MHVELQLELPRHRRAVSHLRRCVQSVCEEMGVSEADRDALALATTEACNNVILHAHLDDTFEVGFQLDESRARVTVTNARTPHLRLDDGATADPMSEDGRGISIMTHLVDEARFTVPEEGGTLVELVRSITPVPGSLLDAQPDDA